MRGIQTFLLIGLSFAWVRGSSRGEEPPTLREAKAAVLEGVERERFVTAHNAARREMGVEGVTWSEKVAAYALEGLVEQQEELIREGKEGWKEGKVALPEHRKDLKFGENIAAWMGSGRGGMASGAERAVAMWMREKAAFDRLNAVKPYRVGDEEQEPGVGGQESGDRKQGTGDRKQESGKEKEQREPKEKEKEKKPPIVVGHYTQIVWRETKEIGAAKLMFELVDERGNRRSYVAIICNYEPPGNRRGEKAF